MSGVDMIGRGTPRSAVRYRSSGETRSDGQQVPVQRASRTRAQQSGVVSTTATRPIADGKEGPATRVRTTAGRQDKSDGRETEERSRRRLEPLILVNVGALMMLVLWLLGTQVFAWGASALNTLRYGYPRSYQIDAVVGHQDSPTSPSHFMAINLHGRVEVIEWPGGDASHARIYLGPQLVGPGADQQPVTLRFADVNGDHRPDMIVGVQNTQIIWINTGSSFRPLNPGEHYSLG
ncbi:MAG TPA: hypothetical protein VKV19_13010 [Ktedonobacteraceae bacterium]|nr:hypothetical protein [Ktedonobacteraceae bacterium]